MLAGCTYKAGQQNHDVLTARLPVMSLLRSVAGRSVEKSELALCTDLTTEPRVIHNNDVAFPRTGVSP